MGLWEVRFSKQGYKDYKALPEKYRKMVDRILSFLMEREKVDIKPVRGEKDVYRLRVGRYRMLVKFYREERIILVIKIGVRGDIYKK